jgi:RNA ligase (TIGR02306 family)
MRKLASIQTIKSVRSIKGADAIECVGVLGWECVSKKGEFREGDPCVYFEIDSLLPEEERYEFLRGSSYKSDLEKFRLRTLKMRGQLSQGLALPLALFPEVANLPVGHDLTELLGVEKYDPPIPAQIAGDTRSFSWPIDKTEEIRVQQDEEYGFLDRLSGTPYYISLKLDGTSCSFIVNPRDGDFHACGRNYSYKRNANHSFWQVAERYSIEEGLRSFGGDFAIQGEVVGPGIQKNPLGLKVADFYAFNVVHIPSRRRLNLDDSLSLVDKIGVNFVPILERGNSFSYSMVEILEKAKGKYKDHFALARESQEREGIVVRSVCSSISFKAINNDFLLSEK